MLSVPAFWSRTRPEPFERIGRVIGVPFGVLFVALGVNEVHRLVRGPIQISCELVYLPGYWTKARRETRFQSIAEIQVRALPRDNVYCRIRLRDGTVRKVGLGTLRRPEAFLGRLEKEWELASRDRQDWGDSFPG